MFSPVPKLNAKVSYLSAGTSFISQVAVKVFIFSPNFVLELESCTGLGNLQKCCVTGNKYMNSEAWAQIKMKRKCKWAVGENIKNVTYSIQLCFFLFLEKSEMKIIMQYFQYFWYLNQLMMSSLRIHFIMKAHDTTFDPLSSQIMGWLMGWYLTWLT